LKNRCVLQDHYDDKRDKTLFHNTTRDMQDQVEVQDHSAQDQEGFFGLRMVLRPTVSDHMTYYYYKCLFFLVTQLRTFENRRCEISTVHLCFLSNIWLSENNKSNLRIN